MSLKKLGLCLALLPCLVSARLQFKVGDTYEPRRLKLSPKLIDRISFAINLNDHEHSENRTACKLVSSRSVTEESEPVLKIEYVMANRSKKTIQFTSDPIYDIDFQFKKLENLKTNNREPKIQHLSGRLPYESFAFFEENGHTLLAVVIGNHFVALEIVQDGIRTFCGGDVGYTWIRTIEAPDGLDRYTYWK